MHGRSPGHLAQWKVLGAIPVMSNVTLNVSDNYIVSQSLAHPYRPPHDDPLGSQEPLTKRQRILLWCGSLFLVLCGLNSVLEWAFKLENGFPRPQHWWAAMLTKDLFFLTPAIASGVSLPFRSHVGWWAAAVCLGGYVAFEILVVGTSMIAGWQFPIGYDIGMMPIVIGGRLIITLIAIAFLLGSAVANPIEFPPARRLLSIVILIFAALPCALLLNWWSSWR